MSHRFLKVSAVVQMVGLSIDSKTRNKRLNNFVAPGAWKLPRLGLTKIVNPVESRDCRILNVYWQWLDVHYHFKASGGSAAPEVAHSNQG